MSEVTGADEVAGDLGSLADLLSVGDTIADAARVRAQGYAPSLAQLDTPAVNFDGVTLNYSGVISPAGFEDFNNNGLEADAADAIEDHINNAIQRAGLA